MKWFNKIRAVETLYEIWEVRISYNDGTEDTIIRYDYPELDFFCGTTRIISPYMLAKKHIRYMESASPGSLVCINKCPWNIGENLINMSVISNVDSYNTGEYICASVYYKGDNVDRIEYNQ